MWKLRGIVMTENEENKETQKVNGSNQQDVLLWVGIFVLCMLISIGLFLAIRMGQHPKVKEQALQNTINKVEVLDDAYEASVTSIGNLLIPRAFHQGLAVFPDDAKIIPFDFSYGSDVANKVLFVGGIYKNIPVKNAEVFDVSSSKSSLIPGSQLNNLTSTLMYGVGHTIYAVNPVKDLKTEKYGIEKYNVDKLTVKLTDVELIPREKIGVDVYPFLKRAYAYIEGGTEFNSFKAVDKVEIIDKADLKKTEYKFKTDITGGTLASDEYGKMFLFGGFNTKTKQISRDIYLIRRDFSSMTKVGELIRPMLSPKVDRITGSYGDMKTSDYDNPSEWLVVNEHLGNITVNLVDTDTYEATAIPVPAYIQKNKLLSISKDFGRAYMFFQKNDLVHVLTVGFGSHEMTPVVKYTSSCTASTYSSLYAKSPTVKTLVSGGLKFVPRSSLNNQSDICSEVKLVEIKKK